jgi:tRNA threonylcarbamoyladenosine biosynthesis protein TsaE
MSSPDHTASLPTLLADTAATTALGAALARLLQPGMTIYLHGDLGAGKTTLVRGLLRALGHSGPVKSPTYTLVELYVFSRYIIYHFDFYRFNRPEEWLEAGLDEHFNAQSVCLVEWPEKVGALLPPPDLEVMLQVVDAPADTGARAQAAMHERIDEGHRKQIHEQNYERIYEEAVYEQARTVAFKAHSERGTSCLNALRLSPPGAPS